MAHIAYVAKGEPGKDGQPGADGRPGADAVIWSIDSNADVIKRDQHGTLTAPSTGSVIQLAITIKRTAGATTYSIDSPSTLSSYGMTLYYRTSPTASWTACSGNFKFNLTNGNPASWETQITSDGMMLELRQGSTVVASRSISVVRDGVPFRGPRKWLELTMNETLYCGTGTEPFFDIVISPDGKYYRCKLTHTVSKKTTAWWDANKGTYFTLINNFGIVASDVILSRLIKACEIESDNLIASELVCNTNGVLTATVNRYGRGEYIQYHSNGNRCFEFNDGAIIRYDSEGNVKWTLGESGDITKQTIDFWTTISLISLGATESAAKTKNDRLELTDNPTTYKVFQSGSSSTNKAYRGLTVSNSVVGSTLPQNVAASSYIPDGYYASKGVALGKPGNGSVTYYRRVHRYSGGYLASTVEWEISDQTI